MITYQPLLDNLKKKKKTLRELMLETGIAPNTMTRIRKNKYVSMEILEKFCSALQCDFKDIINYVPENGWERRLVGQNNKTISSGEVNEVTDGNNN